MASLLGLASPLDAALSHLLLTTHESGLPKRFIAGGEGFVSSAYSGNVKEELSMRWMRERAMKEAGWPERAVREWTEAQADGPGADWGLLMEGLGRRLVGLEALMAHSEADDDSEQKALRSEELEAVQAVYPNALYDKKTCTLAVPVGGSECDVILNVVYSPYHPYPTRSCDRPPPMYITSRTVPPYVRLHLLSRILVELYGMSGASSTLHSDLEAGGQVVFACLEYLEALWTAIQEDNSATHHPDVSEVMKHLLPAPRSASPSEAPEGPRMVPSTTPAGRSRKLKTQDPRSDEQVLSDFESARKDKKEYTDVMNQRTKLPAWDARGKIIDLVERHRVVVVVGETGCGKTTQCE